MKKYIFILLAFGLMLQPNIASAADRCGVGSEEVGSLFGAQFCSVNELVVKIINFLLTIIAVVAVLFIVIGGFRYVMSAGNEEQAAKARKVIINAIIGLIIAIFAYTIVAVLAKTIGTSVNESRPNPPGNLES